MNHAVSYKQNNQPVKMSEKENWLKQLDQIIENCPLGQTLDNQELAQQLHVSERHLFRKVKKLTGKSPQSYLREHRLKTAYELLKTGKCRRVNEAAFAIGYVNVGHFITQFEKAFGLKPFEVLQINGWR